MSEVEVKKKRGRPKKSEQPQAQAEALKETTKETSENSAIPSLADDTTNPVELETNFTKPPNSSGEQNKSKVKVKAKDTKQKQQKKSWFWILAVLAALLVGSLMLPLRETILNYLMKMKENSWKKRSEEPVNIWTSEQTQKSTES